MTPAEQAGYDLGYDVGSTVALMGDWFAGSGDGGGLALLMFLVIAGYALGKSL